MASSYFADSSRLDRRRFLKIAGGTFLAASTARLYGSAAETPATLRTDGKTPISFLEPAEVLICGSTLFACDMALQSARAGKQTTLVMEKVNPFFEGISCLRSWIDADAVHHARPLLSNLLDNPLTISEKAGRIYFNAMRAALEIEDRLCEAGVRILYNAPVAGALGQSATLAGAVFGGKPGLFAIESPVLIDATPEATLARAAGGTFTPNSAPRKFHYIADLANTASPRKFAYTASSAIPVQVEIDHYFAHFSMVLEKPAAGPMAHAIDFEKVYAASLECPFEKGEARFRGADAFLSSGADKLQSTDGSVEGFSNLLVFGPHGVSGNSEGSLILEKTGSLFEAFPNAMERVLSALKHAKQAHSGAAAPGFAFWNRGVETESEPSTALCHSFRDPGFSEAGSRLEDIVFSPPKVVLETEVLVVGGGTSGNAATYAAADLGMKTVCLERGLELGGTNTIGGVTNLWFGNKTKAFEAYYRAMEAKNDALNAPGFFKGVKKAGATVLFGSTITGVARRDRSVERIYVITPVGLCAVTAPKIIEATGDGSVAAWAGCAYTFGGIHDEMTLWGSFAGFKPGKPEALRPFLSPCDERSALDATRFILSMRRNGRLNADFPHIPPPFYLAPRESRHIQGGRTLTYLDVLAGRRFRDGVFRVESNPDIKGLATSDAAKAGLIPTNWKLLFRATVPYSAMIPAHIDNVIIAGKAYSATHDALSVARMQRDLCVMGMVAAEAVLLSKKCGVLLRDVPIGELQGILISKQMLNPTDIAEDDLGFGASAEAIAAKVAGTRDFDAALSASAQLCLLPRSEVLAAVAKHAESAGAPMLRLLAFLGHPKGVETQLASITEAMNQRELDTEVFGGQGTKHTMPDQGYAPVSALMLGALARLGEKRAVPLLCRLGERLPTDQIDLRHGWGYLFALACSFERMPSTDGAKVLTRLLDGELFKNRVVERTGDLRPCSDYVSERFVYLRMALSRALLRCGEKRGARELCALLGEARVCFSRAARAELATAFGRDHGFNVALWEKEIAAGHLKTNPLTTEFM